MKTEIKKKILASIESTERDRRAILVMDEGDLIKEAYHSGMIAAYKHAILILDEIPESQQAIQRDLGVR